MKSLPLTGIALLIVPVILSWNVKAADNAPATERELVKIEHEWGDALVHRDAAALASILADDYILTTPYGQVVTKTQLVSSLKTPRADSFEMKGVEQEDVSTRFYGNTAVVYSRFTLKGEVEGKEVETPFRHTDVFVKQEGRWRCVARQATLIAEPVAPVAVNPPRWN